MATTFSPDKDTFVNIVSYRKQITFEELNKFIENEKKHEA